MCLLLLQPKSLPALPMSVFDNGWSHNDDGAGIAYIADGKLVIEKGFFKLKHLKAAYYTAHTTHGADSPIMVHFRWATTGGLCEDNCHPFPVCDNRIAVGHNGILPFDPPKNSGMSDTRYFCCTVLNYRAYHHMLDATFREIVEEMVGHNKLVFLGDTGEYSIINEKLGTWDEGVWYSNNDYKDSWKGYHWKGNHATSPASCCVINGNAAIASGPMTLPLVGGDGAGQSEIVDSPDPVATYTPEPEELAAVRGEFDELLAKAESQEGLSLDEWERFEICSDLLYEWGCGESEEEREKREWAEYAKEHESKDMSDDERYWTHKDVSFLQKIDRELDTVPT